MLRGRVTARSDARPLSGAAVAVSRAGSRLCEVQTDAEGRFECRGLPPGTLDLAVRCEGFHALEGSVEVASGSAAELFAGRVVPGAGAFAASLEIALPIEQRRRLRVDEYEMIRSADGEIDRAPYGSIRLPRGEAIAYLGVLGGRRVYSSESGPARLQRRG